MMMMVMMMMMNISSYALPQCHCTFRSVCTTHGLPFIQSAA
jgi:hypothetical protein